MNDPNPKGGVNVTRIILFIILAVLLAASGWDQYARYVVNKHHRFYMGDIDDKGEVIEAGEIDQQNRAAVAESAKGSDKSTLKTDSFITPEKVQERLGRSPATPLTPWRDKGVQTEDYVWPAGFPGRTYNLICIYQPYTGADKKKHLRLVRVEKNISLDQLEVVDVPAAPEEGISETPSLDAEKPQNNPKLQPPPPPGRTPPGSESGKPSDKSSGGDKPAAKDPPKAEPAKSEDK